MKLGIEVKNMVRNVDIKFQKNPNLNRGEIAKFQKITKIPFPHLAAKCVRTSSTNSQLSVSR